MLRTQLPQSKQKLRLSYLDLSTIIKNYLVLNVILERSIILVYGLAYDLTKINLCSQWVSLPPWQKEKKKSIKLISAKQPWQLKLQNQQLQKLIFQLAVEELR